MLKQLYVTFTISLKAFWISSDEMATSDVIKFKVVAMFGVDFSEEEAAKILHEDEIYIDIDLHQGDVSAKAWGCDLTYDYVKINGDYRS